ncbi:MAG: hypothetical protein M3067_05945 [Chloroflexota bacterium]|nr:hypothetical protein [Chloroflexota bacterium]MDQ6898244.1 hypothetical protein [Candidatus Dormibacteraeota bacterium]
MATEQEFRQLDFRLKEIARHLDRIATVLEGVQAGDGAPGQTMDKAVIEDVAKEVLSAWAERRRWHSHHTPEEEPMSKKDDVEWLATFAKRAEAELGIAEAEVVGAGLESDPALLEAYNTQARVELAKAAVLEVITGPAKGESVGEAALRKAWAAADDRAGTTARKADAPAAPALTVAARKWLELQCRKWALGLGYDQLDPAQQMEKFQASPAGQRALKRAHAMALG